MVPWINRQLFSEKRFTRNGLSRRTFMNNAGIARRQPLRVESTTCGLLESNRSSKAQQSDALCVRHVDMAWLGTVGAAGLFVDGWFKNGEGAHQTQPHIVGAGGRD